MDGVVVLIISCLAVLLVLFTYVSLWRVPSYEAYVRIGLGGQRVFMPHTYLFVLPIFNQVNTISLKSFSVAVEASEDQSVLSNDPLKVDIKLGLLCGVKRSHQDVLRFITVLNGREDLLSSLIHERCLDALKVVSGQLPLESLLLNPLALEMQIRTLLTEQLAPLGLEVFLVSVGSIQPTSRAFYRPQDSLLDSKGISLLDHQRLEYEYQLHKAMNEVALAVKRLEIDAVMKVAEWEANSALALLERKRHTLAASTQLEQEMAEIELSQALAMDILHQDLYQVRAQAQTLLTTQRKIAVAA